jgi:hypothetical protein
MVDQIFARVTFLRHRPVHIVLEPDVTVEIDLARHHGLAGQVDVRRPNRHPQFTALAYLGELAILDDECGVLDGWAVVTCDHPRAYNHSDAGCPRPLAKQSDGKQH